MVKLCPFSFDDDMNPSSRCTTKVNRVGRLCGRHYQVVRKFLTVCVDGKPLKHEARVVLENIMEIHLAATQKTNIRRRENRKKPEVKKREREATVAQVAKIKKIREDLYSMSAEEAAKLIAERRAKQIGFGVTIPLNLPRELSPSWLGYSCTDLSVDPMVNQCIFGASAADLDYIFRLVRHTARNMRLSPTVIRKLSYPAREPRPHVRLVFVEISDYGACFTLDTEGFDLESNIESTEILARAVISLRAKIREFPLDNPLEILLDAARANLPDHFFKEEIISHFAENEKHFRGGFFSLMAHCSVAVDHIASLFSLRLPSTRKLQGLKDIEPNFLKLEAFLNTQERLLLFLGGHVYGDGSISINKEVRRASIEWLSASRNLVDWIAKQVGTLIGRTCNVITRQGKEGKCDLFTVTTANRKALKFAKIAYPVWKLDELRLERKVEKLAEIIEMYE